jgi:hypothetical protein
MMEHAGAGEFAESFRVLLQEGEKNEAVQALQNARPHQLGGLTADDLLPLLSDERADWRLVAISASAHVGKGPAASDPAPRAAAQTPTSPVAHEAELPLGGAPSYIAGGLPSSPVRRAGR